MSSSATISSRGFFSSEDLTLCKEVFEDVCASNGTDPESPAASQLAKALMVAFESGTRDKEGLLAMLVTAAVRRVG